MADIKELYGLLQQADAAAQSGNTQAIADVQAILGEIDRISAQQPQVAAAPVEQPGALAMPIEGGGLPQRTPTAPESDRVALDSPNITPEFASDFRIITGLNPYSIGKTPREALTGALARGAIDPSFVPGQDFGAFASQWEPYKQESQSSMLGAFARGAESAVGPTLAAIPGSMAGQAIGVLGGGAIGGVLGGPAGMAIGAKIGGGLGMMAGGAAGATLGSLVQQGAESMLGFKTDQDIAQDQLDQERAATRYARLAGEIVPQFTTMRPAIGSIGKAVAGDIGAATSLAAGTMLGGGIPAIASAVAGEPIDTERVVVGALSGMLLEPNRFGQSLYDRAARTEIGALNARNATVQQFAADIGSAAAELADSPNLVKNGVKLGAGSLSNDEGLIALEQHVFNRDPALRGQRARDIEQIALNVDRQMQPRGASPAQTERFFIDDLAEMSAKAEQAFQEAIARGDQYAQGILQNAQQAAQRSQELHNAGLMTAELAHSLAVRNFSEAAAQINEFQGNRAPAAETVLRVLNDNAKVAHDAAKALAVNIPPNITTQFDNFTSAANAAVKDMSEFKKLPGPLRAMIEARKPKFAEDGTALHAGTVEFAEDGTALHAGTVESAVKDAGLLAEMLRDPKIKKSPSTVRLITKVREGLEKDIETVGEQYSELKAFRAAWRDYSEKFVNNDSQKVLLTGSIDPNIVIDHYMKKSGTIKGLAGAEQLRAAIGDSPTALRAVEDWFMSKMANVIGVAQTEKVLTEANIRAAENWLASDAVQELLKVFPSAGPKMASKLARLELNRVATEARVAEVKAASVKKPDVIADRLRTMAIETKKTAEAAAAKALQVEQKAIAEHVAQRFIGTSPKDAIGGILSSKSVDSVRLAEDLLAAAAKDPTGQAVQGIRNAMRDYVNEQIRAKGSVASSKNVPDGISKRELETTLGKLGALLIKDTKERRVIETILGKESEDLKNLDLASQQLEVLSRRKRATAGMSQTTPQKAIEEQIQQQMDFSALNFLGRLSRGMSVRDAGQKGYLRSTVDLIQRVWSGDIQEKAYAAIRDTIADPEKLRTALLETTPENMPAIRGWLKTYGIPYTFDVNNSDMETIGQGGAVTDRENGFRVISKDNKKFKVFSPAGKLLGIYDNPERASQAADVEILKARKLK
jgi:hypothetical protein